MAERSYTGRTRVSRVRLTDAFVDRASRNLPKPGAGGATRQRLYHDSVVNGLGLRVTSGGAVSFIFSYTSPETGASRRYTIGPYGEGAYTTATARKEALRLSNLVGVEKIDPFENEVRRKATAKRAAEDAVKRITFAQVAEEFLKQEVDLDGDGALRPVTRREYRRHLQKHLVPALGAKEVAAITKPDVLQIRKALSGTPYEANHSLRVLRRVLNWAKEVHAKALSGFEVSLLFRSNSSASGDRKKSLFLDEPPRETWISDQDKVAELSRELRAMRTPTARVALFSLFTGCRKRDALRARWEQFDFADKTWTVPAGTRKGNKTHAFPMSAAMIALVQEIQSETKKRGKSAWLFPSPDPAEPLAEINYEEWRETCRRVGLAGLRPHDLKRTVVSHLLAAGKSPKLIAELVGNADPSVIERNYAFVMDATRRQTLAAWSEYLAASEKKAEEAAQAPLAAVVPIGGEKS